MRDLHTHILPGMDDGAPDAAAALAMLRMEAGQGVTGAALTPHFHRRRETPERFLARRADAWRRLEAALGEEALPALVPGAEVAWAPNLDRWDELEALCLGRSRYLLLELPASPWDSALLDQLYSLAGRGTVTPVLAHLERYLGSQRPDHIREVLGLGVPVQLSASCLLRPLAWRRAAGLLRTGGCFLLASDCHDTSRRPPDLEPGMAMAEKRLGRGAAAALLAAGEEIFAAALGEEAANAEK